MINQVFIITACETKFKIKTWLHELSTATEQDRTVTHYILLLQNVTNFPISIFLRHDTNVLICKIHTHNTYYSFVRVSAVNITHTHIQMFKPFEC